MGTKENGCRKHGESTSKVSLTTVASIGHIHSTVPGKSPLTRSGTLCIRLMRRQLRRRLLLNFIRFSKGRKHPESIATPVAPDYLWPLPCVHSWVLPMAVQPSSLGEYIAEFVS
jgi:hypothetical protein